MRLIIDCNFLCYRSMYSMEGLSHNEKQVGVIYGFMRQLLKLSQDFNTANIVFCWDSRQSYRKLIYPDYKGNRRGNLTEEQVDDLALAHTQFEDLRNKILPYMGFRNIFHQTGYEADDLISWICARFPAETIIVSSDKDLYQLLFQDRFNPVKMFTFKSMMDEEHFTRNWYGLKPVDWMNVKSIAGCSTDNINGVEGVGDITAAKYLAGVLKGKNTIAKIEASKELIDFNFKLVSLPFRGKKDIDIECINDDEISFDKFKVTFGQYGFRSLLVDSEVQKWSKSFFGRK
jgi:DNA polymerase-1